MTIQSNTVKKARDDKGRYNFNGNWDRACRCGHTLLVHLANPPRWCGECDCKEFKHDE